MPGPGLIFKQIEEAAGYFDPATYSNLLSFSKVFHKADDSEAQKFVPLTAPRRVGGYTFLPSKKDCKMFVVGILPPTMNLTGRTIDRSATTNQLGQKVVSGANTQTNRIEGSLSEAPVLEGAPGPVVTIPGYQMEPVNGSAAIDLPAPAPSAVTFPKATKQVLNSAQEYKVIYDAYVAEYGKEPSPSECLFYTALVHQATGGKVYNNNISYIGNTKNPKEPNDFLHGDGRYYRSYPTLQDSARHMLRIVAKNPNSVATAKSGDLLGFSTSLAQADYYEAPVGSVYENMARLVGGNSPLGRMVSRNGGPKFPQNDLPRDAPDTPAFRENLNQYYARIGVMQNGKFVSAKKLEAIKASGVSILRFQADSVYDDANPIFPDDSPTPTAPDQGFRIQAASWDVSGSVNAQQASKAQAKTANTQLPQDLLAQNLQKEQQQAFADARAALDKMASTPPLRMLVNPMSFKLSDEKILSDGNWSRTGPIVEQWGEQQARIDASGKVAGFYAIDTAKGSFDGSVGNSPGLTRTARNFTASYQNFLALYLIYRNNGALWLKDYASASSTALNLAAMGSVYIYYDNILYIGSFDSFNVTEAEETPFSLEYDFSFTVRAAFLLDTDNSLMSTGKEQSVRAPEILTGADDPLGAQTSEELLGAIGVVNEENLGGELTSGDLNFILSESEDA